MSEKYRNQRLLNQMIEGNIAPDDLEHLQTELRSSREFRQQYYDLLAVDQLLTERFEVPDYIAIHAQAVDNTWAIHRFRKQLIFRSLAGAAAILTLGLLLFYGVRARAPQIYVDASSDGHYFINEEQVRESDPRPWLPGQSLEMRYGAASVALTPQVRAFVEAPALLRLRDSDGSVDLVSGKAHFQISPGGKGFEVHVPGGGIIRDIGTKFGVEVFPDGSSEVHVSTGAVEIETAPGKKPFLVEAGEAAAWVSKGKPKAIDENSGRFVQSLPIENELFRDDFSERDGTPLANKRPDIGQPWMIWREDNPTNIMGGSLDTSYGSRAITGGFRQNPLPGRRSVFLVTIQTKKPQNTEDKDLFSGSTEEITIWGDRGEEIFALWAGTESEHQWRLHDAVNETYSSNTGLDALSPLLLTLRYERETGLLALYHGASAQGTLINEIRIPSGHSPSFLTIGNSQGGDVSIDRISAKVVTYEQKTVAPN